MAKKELRKPTFLFLFALLLLLMTSSSQCRAEGISRLSSSTKTTRKLLEQDYPGHFPSVPSDYDYNDFYRRQGDVPSPGIGH
ncbi:Potassium transporter 2 isoform 1 [Hibiscus syriacus]|uniref:Potassium transporter 2 isoform 1 n=1 Tax=Hibiscus syriacus TaxID=106335 RepID=A0A6A2Z3Q5_HIBSY|nr:Potassium transporter 2 isoform 1 [Hibiscus syriacus]